MKKHSRYNVAKNSLLFWCLFIGVGAVAGATGMFVDPSGAALGMDAMLPYFQVLPFSEVLFQDFVFPGIALLIVNGLTNLTAAALILAKKRVGDILGGVFGLTLMAWIVIQFVIFPANFMSTIYFIFGFIQAVTGYVAFVFYKQEHFVFDEKQYTNIGTNHEELVVYFSRLGFTQKIAYETADLSSADIYEIHSSEPTEGTLGFWWCGRFALHKWEMPIEEIPIDLSAYKKVTICSLVWAFGIAAPVRSFIKTASGKIAKVDYVLVHHTSARYISIADEMDALLKIKRERLLSYSCKSGTYRKVL